MCDTCIMLHMLDPYRALMWDDVYRAACVGKSAFVHRNSEGLVFTVEDSK